jgi:two-component sensor histidine kinase
MAPKAPDPRDNAMAVFLRGLRVDENATVSLKRVLRQRTILAELSAVFLLESSLDVLLGEASRVAAEGCNAPFAKVLQHRPREGQFIVRAGVGWKSGVVGHARARDDSSNPAGESFRTRQPIRVTDVRTRGDYHLPPIYPDHGIVSSANVPIIGGKGFYGVLEVDRRDDRPFDTLDTSFLARIAGIIADAVERVRREAGLRAAHEARAVLLREHHHRVRNGFQAIIARVQRHIRQATGEDSRQRLGDVERRVFALAALYAYLVGVEPSGNRIDFARYLGDLCSRMREFYAVDEHGIELSCGCTGDVEYDLDTCRALGTAINELVANAVEHAFGPEGGRIEVRLRRGADTTILTVADNGAGFKKAAPESIGLSVVENLVSGIGGSMSRTRRDDGTTWVLTLPGSPEGF